MEDQFIIKYLKNQLNAESKAEFENWVNSSEENMKYFEEFKSLWIKAGNIKELAEPNIDNAWNKLDKEISQINIWSKYKTVFKYAAAIVVIFIVYALLRTQVFENNYTEVISGDSVRKIILADNSIIWLNKHSKVSYNYDESSREVKLEGEAFFEVQHDDKKPFTIAAQGAQIKDIGTSFNVTSNTEENQLKIAVVSGIVSFSKKSKEVILVANQVGEIIDGDQIIVKKVTDINENAWLTGKLVFRNQTLSEIADILESTYDVNVIFANKHISDLQITASFDHQTLEEVLSILGMTTNLKYIIRGSEVIISD